MIDSSRGQQEEVERFPVNAVHRCDAIFSVAGFPSVLLLVCGSNPENPEILFFSCEAVSWVLSSVVLSSLVLSSWF